MAALFEEKGFGAAAAFVERRVEPGADSRARSAGAAISRATCFPNTYALPRRATADTLVERMVAEFEKVALAGAARARRGARPVGARARHAGVDRREGNRHARGAPARRRRLQQPAPHRHGAAVRSHGDLRARARRPLRRQHPARRPAHRLAVQHLSLCRPAAGADRRAGPRRARSGRGAGRRAVSSTSSAATTARTPSPRPSTSTIATCTSIRSSISAIGGRTGGLKDAQGARVPGCQGASARCQVQSAIHFQSEHVVMCVPVLTRR